MTWKEALEEIRAADNGTSVQDELYRAVAEQIEANRNAIVELRGELEDGDDTRSDYCIR